MQDSKEDIALVQLETKKEVDIEKLKDLIVQLNTKVTSVLPTLHRIEEENEKLHQIVDYLVQEVTNLKLQRHRDNLENSLEILRRLKVDPGGDIKIPFTDTEEEDVTSENESQTNEESDECINLYTRLTNVYETQPSDEKNFEDTEFDEHIKELREETEKIRKELEIAKLNTEKQYFEWLGNKV